MTSMSGAGGAGGIRGLATLQILLDLKSTDPTALTAAEAIRNLLGLGDRLVELRRRTLHEVLVQSRDGAASPDGLPHLLSAYLERTVVFWNPNKQLAWVRLEATAGGISAWEILPGGRRREGTFGRPDLASPEYDHLLTWPRGRRGAPADLGPALVGWELAAAGQGELCSLRWREGAPAAERAEWTRSVGAARSRTEGLLFNPHAEDHRVFAGAVPVPLWSGGEAGNAGVA